MHIYNFTLMFPRKRTGNGGTGVRAFFLGKKKAAKKNLSLLGPCSQFLFCSWCDWVVFLGVIYFLCARCLDFCLSCNEPAAFFALIDCSHLAAFFPSCCRAPRIIPCLYCDLHPRCVRRSGGSLACSGRSIVTHSLACNNSVVATHAKTALPALDITCCNLICSCAPYIRARTKSCPPRVNRHLLQPYLFVRAIY